MTQPDLQAMPVSILVCTRDRRETLDLLLGDLSRLQSGREVQVVVVEENDEPRLPPFQHPTWSLEYVPHPLRNLGIAYARNMALSRAAHDLVVFVDDDCRVPPEWLERLLAPFEDPEVLGAQGGVVVPEGTGPIGWAETLLGFPGGGIARIHASAGQKQPTHEVSTLNAAYRKAVVDAVGGFSDQARFGGEDYLLAKQVAEKGQLIFVPEAEVAHLARGGWGPIGRWFVRRGRAEIDLIHAGIAPAGYPRFLLGSSLGLKLGAVVVVSAATSWWGLLPLALLAVAGVGGWRLRWALNEPRVPRAAVWVAPWVRIWMDLSADLGRLQQMWRNRSGQL